LIRTVLGGTIAGEATEWATATVFAAEGVP